MARCNADAIARMRHRLTIQSVTRASDGQGGFTETWVDGDTIWASIEPVSAWEKMQAMQMQVPVSHKIVVRYRGDITAACRLYGDGRIYEIKEAIDKDSDRAFLTIKAVEIATPPAVENIDQNIEDISTVWA